MKFKWIGIIFTIVIAISGTLYFTVFNMPSLLGEITYVGESFIMLEVSDNPGHNGSYSISISEETKIVNENNIIIDKDYLSIGDTVKITYKGSIAESDPALIQECVKVVLYTEN